MKQQKSVLRDEMKAVRKRLYGQDNGAASRLIAAKILMLPEVAGTVQYGIRASRSEPHIVAGFSPIQTEPDGLYILKALSAIQCRCALPVMTGKDSPLTFREWDLAADLKDGPFGTREPAPEWPCVMPDIILVPLLAFDGNGHRLGYGGGYYDRTLDIYRQKGHSFTAIGVAYDGQKRDHVPHNHQDQPLDIIVTEQDMYRP